MNWRLLKLHKNILELLEDSVIVGNSFSAWDLILVEWSWGVENEIAIASILDHHILIIYKTQINFW